MYKSGHTILICAIPLVALPAQAGALVISGKTNVVIERQNLSSADSDCLQVINSKNITVRDSVFYKCYGVGISIERSSNITIENSYFEDLNGGVYALSSSSIKVLNNRFKNVSRAGKLNDARGQFVQFDTVTGAGNQVKNNTGGNIVTSDPEDLISMYKSTGTSSSPIEISGNCFESPVGAYTSDSGSGMILGDGGGSYQYAHDNILINPGQVGVGVAGGTNIKVERNKIRGDLDPNCQQDCLSNVGLYVWNQSGKKCTSVSVSGNEVQWMGWFDGWVNNPSWDGGGCGKISGWSQNNWYADLSALTCRSAK